MKPTPHNHSLINGLSILDMVIDDLTARFRKLERSPDFKYKQYKIEKTRKLIGDLYDVHDSIAFLYRKIKGVFLHRKIIGNAWF